MGAVQDDSAWEAARAAHCDAFVAARAADDVGAMSAAALGLASLQRFGGPGGRTPALLHEAYLAAGDSAATRARLAAALARSWVYGNDAVRGAPFALEAVELAEETRDPTVLADALDAQLATSWGPDDLSERLHISARLQDVAAHVDDVRTRMDANLWRLTTALETLDVTGMHRQLSALDLLADETGSPLVRYFAQKYARRMKRPIETIPVKAMTALSEYHWPGNVREMENFIERAVILSRGSELQIPVAELKPRNGIGTPQLAATNGFETLEHAEREHNALVEAVHGIAYDQQHDGLPQAARRQHEA